LCCDYLKNDLWLFRLEYLTDIYGQLNRLNSSLQGRNENILISMDKLVAFTKKVILWKSRVKAGILDMFPLVRKTFVKEMIPIIVEYLTCLEMRAEEYFPSMNVDEFDWIRNPFVKLIDSSNFALSKEEELASLSSDRGLRVNHAELPLDAFWISIMQEYPSNAKKVMKVLLQFSSSHLGFLSETILKIQNWKVFRALRKN